jgi:hypothetical protein
MRRKIKRIARKINIKYLIAVIAIIIILAFIITYLTPEEKYSFEEVFNQVKFLDEKYNTDFKKEDLTRVIIDYQNIDPYLEELSSFRGKVVKTYNNPTDEEKAIITLIDARTLMLLSQKNYHQAKIYGGRGVVTDIEGFSCSEAGYIINAAYYYNLTWASGVQAYITLDQLLDVYRDVPNVWDLVGINKDKPLFFYASIGDIKMEVTTSVYALENFCLINLSRGLTNLVDPEIYFNLESNPDLMEEILANQQANFNNISQETGMNISY